jgi:hypothetical protein
MADGKAVVMRSNGINCVNMFFSLIRELIKIQNLREKLIRRTTTVMLLWTTSTKQVHFTKLLAL